VKAAGEQEQMASELSRTGRMALYGLYFNRSPIEIKPESSMSDVIGLIRLYSQFLLLRFLWRVGRAKHRMSRSNQPQRTHSGLSHYLAAEVRRVQA
jgi:hypothetical protein